MTRTLGRGRKDAMSIASFDFGASRRLARLARPAASAAVQAVAAARKDRLDKAQQPHA